MSYANRMLELPTSRTQQLVQLVIVAALAFSLGTAARRTGPDTSSAQRAIVAPATQSAAAVAGVPYTTGWELYDDGWAGGPAPRTETRMVSAAIRIPYETGWELYDGGWAGGPNTVSAGSAHPGRDRGRP